MTKIDKLAADPRIEVRHGAAIDPRGQCVLYRMRRTQRALDNPALETAIAVANLLEQPVVVFFGSLAHHPLANLRHYSFMIEGLAETAQKLVQRRIGFVSRICSGASSDREFERFCAEVRPTLVVCDEDPARRDAKWRREALLYPSAPLWSVDADVVVPSKLLEKEQFAARTIRPRIQGRLKELFQPVGNRTVRVPGRMVEKSSRLPFRGNSRTSFISMAPSVPPISSTAARMLRSPCFGDLFATVWTIMPAAATIQKLMQPANSRRIFILARLGRTPWRSRSWCSGTRPRSRGLSRRADRAARACG